MFHNTHRIGFISMINLRHKLIGNFSIHFHPSNWKTEKFASVAMYREPQNIFSSHFDYLDDKIKLMFEFENPAKPNYYHVQIIVVLGGIYKSQIDWFATAILFYMNYVYIYYLIGNESILSVLGKIEFDGFSDCIQFPSNIQGELVLHSNYTVLSYY